MGTRLRVGLIGTGRWGQVYLRTLQQLAPRCELTAVCCRRPDQAVQIPSTAAVVADWPAVVRSPCDAVIIATPPDTHADMLTACLAAGKPCIVEKPLCLGVDTAEHLDRLVEETGVPVLVDHTPLFSSAYQALTRHLDPATDPIRVILSEGMALGPFRHHTPALWDWAVHDVSLCLDLLGYPSRVDALGGPVDPEGEAEAVSLLLRFAQGASAWIQAGRLGPVKRRSFSVLTERRLYRLDDLAADKLAVAEIEFSSRYRAGIPDPLAWQMIPVDPSLPMHNMLSYFLDGLSGGDRSRFGTALAVKAVRVLAACAQIMRQRRVIS